MWVLETDSASSVREKKTVPLNPHQALDKIIFIDSLAYFTSLQFIDVSWDHISKLHEFKFLFWWDLDQDIFLFTSSYKVTMNISISIIQFYCFPILRDGEMKEYWLGFHPWPYLFLIFWILISEMKYCHNQDQKCNSEPIAYFIRSKVKIRAWHWEQKQNYMWT